MHCRIWVAKTFVTPLYIGNSALMLVDEDKSMPEELD